MSAPGHPELSTSGPIEPGVPELQRSLGGRVEAAVVGCLGRASHQGIDCGPAELGVAGRALEPGLGQREALPLDRPESDPARAARADELGPRLALHAAVVVASIRRQAELAHESLPPVIVMARPPMVEIASHVRDLVRDGAVEPIEPLVAEHVERELDVATGGHGEAGGGAQPGAQFDTWFRTERLAERTLARPPPVADAILGQTFPIGTEDGDGAAHHAFRNGWNVTA